MELESFIVIIAGCRDFNNYELLKEKCDHMLSKKKDTHKVIIVSGHAAVANALGEVYALERGVASRHTQPIGRKVAWRVPCVTKKWRGLRMLLLTFGMESPGVPRT